MYRVVIRTKAEKQLKKIPSKYQRKIKQVLKFIKADPLSGKKLSGEHQGKYVIRAWPYRIIYTVHKKKVTVYILAIGHRQRIY